MYGGGDTMALIEVAKLSDVPEGSLKHVEIDSKEILLANVGGTIYAMDDRCGHMNASLAMGVLDGYVVKCALHHAQFDVATGKKVQDGRLGGASGALITKTKTGKIMNAIKTHDVQTYEVDVTGDSIKVNL
jgi:nitrite reductase/ring-hydroxylating ferredoxin subunit